MPKTKKPAARQETLFPTNAPKSLIREYQRLGSYRKVAHERGVSPPHVRNLLKFGKEPKRQDLRDKLGLSKKYRKPVPAWVSRAADHLAELEAKAGNRLPAVYSRDGKKVR